MAIDPSSGRCREHGVDAVVRVSVVVVVSTAARQLLARLNTHHSPASSGCLPNKLAFHDADNDTDIDTDILARILADTSDTRDFLKLFL